MSQTDLFSYFRSFYVPENKCVVVVGDFDKPKMLEQLHSLFGREKQGQAPAAPLVQIENNPGSHTIIKRPVQMSYLAMGRPVPGLGSKDLVALDVLADVLGGGASSRIYQHLRESKQSVLSISVDYTPFSQKGLFSVFAEALPEKAESMVREIQEELNKIENEPIRPEELARAKARIKSEWLHGAESPRGQASTLGSLAVFRKEGLVNNYLSDIENLTVDHLMEMYRTHLKDKTFTITQLVPNTATAS